MTEWMWAGAAVGVALWAGSIWYVSRARKRQRREHQQHKLAMFYTATCMRVIGKAEPTNKRDKRKLEAYIKSGQAKSDFGRA